MKPAILIILCSFSLDAGIASWWKNREAVQLCKNENYDHALLLYNDLIDNDPYNPIYNYNIGGILYKQNRFEDAQKAFQRAVSYANNKNIEEYASYGAGNSFYQLSQWQNAIDRYEHALKINYNNEHTQHNLRLAREKLAEEQLKKMQDQQQNSDGQEKKQEKQQDTDESGSDNSQGSSGSQSEQQSPGNQGKGDQKNQKTQSGKEGDNNKEKALKDSKSGGEEDDIQQESAQSTQDYGQSGSENIHNDNGEQQEQDTSSKPGQEQDESSENLDEKLKQNQQKLDDIASQVERNEKESSQAGDKKTTELEHNKAPKNQAETEQEPIPNIDDGKGSSGPLQNKKSDAITEKKPELKNELQELYEEKSSQDERLDDYYAEIVKLIENREDNIQRQVIKNRVATKMTGQHGKKGW